MKFKKISTRMLAFILPIFILAMGLLTLISALKSKQIILEETGLYMNAKLQSSQSEVTDYLDAISSSAFATARMFGNNYKNMQIADIENSLKQIANDNDLIFGCGVWFEPYVYQSDAKYMGPYAYKDGSNMVLTYDYSNESYDYFNQPYYTMTKGAKAPAFMDPYYDATSGITMATCSSPMYDANGTYLGCVTLDISLETIQKLVTSAKIGKNGEAILLQKDGTYLAAGDTAKVSKALKITDESNQQLKKVGQTILDHASGTVSYKEQGTSYVLYYTTFESNGWKLIAKIPTQDINAPTQQLVGILILVCVIAVVISVFVVLYQVRFISRRIGRVKTFAGLLAEGNFTASPLKIYADDELGSMGRSLNLMFEKNKEVLLELSEDAKSIYTSSENLSDSAKLLLEEFQNIETYMSGVNEEMISASRSTQSVHASAQNVDTSSKILADEAVKSKKMADEIKIRAKNVETISKDSYTYAVDLSVQYEHNLQKSIENAKVVEEIGKLAEVISGIAEQINLLSLNASIEAARAGEQGKGFAVVAEEIGKLATQTSETVNEIQDTISKVQGAFTDVTEDSKKIITFVSDVVTPDYEKFVEIGKQYGLDANSVEDISSNISEMSKAIKDTIGEVSKAIEGINESAQRTAQSTARSMKAVQSLSEAVNTVSNMSYHEREIANNLNAVASRFVIEGTMEQGEKEK